MAYADTDDVQARLGRELTPPEVDHATALLSDIELIIKSKIPDLDDKIADNDIDVGVVVMVEASAVVRVLKNPDGYLSESDGDYSYQRNTRIASGALEVQPHEWALLGVNSSVFFIHPRVKTPFEEFTSTVDPTSVEYAVWMMNSSIFWR